VLGRAIERSAALTPDYTPALSGILQRVRPEESTTPDAVGPGRIERVRALVRRWNSGDHSIEGLPEHLDPAFELVSPLSSFAGEPYRGYTGIERWARELDEQFAEWSIDLEDVRQIGDQVLVTATINARGRASDVALRFRSGSVFGFASDGRVLRAHIYPDVDAALKAIGLSE
jgi:ketosteroid isomerase-like protein